MRKHYLIFFLLFGLKMWSVSASDFLIGAYSQYQIRYAGPDYETNFEDLGTFLQNAGYNATVYELSSGYSTRLSHIFPTLENADVKSILADNTWYNGSEVGVSSLSFGNRLQIEAEYQFKTYLDGSFMVDELNTPTSASCMEAYDYITVHETGDYVNDSPPTTTYSNNVAWLCDASQGDSAGVALSQPRKRWKPSDKAWPGMLSTDLAFLTSALSQNKLYLTVAMRFEGVAMGDPVANVSLKFYDPLVDSQYSEYDPIPDPSRYISLPLVSCNSLYSSNITAQAYPSSMLDEHSNYLFEYYLNMPLPTSSPLIKNYGGISQFYHINPELYWHGNGKLIIDYIVIEDEFNRSVRINPNSPYISQLNNQINNLTNYDTSNNLLYYYGKDEPRAGQLQMYKSMQNHLESLNPPRKLITVMWLKDYGIMKHDGTPYNYHKRFLTESNPDRIMVDIYAISGSPIWNGHLGFSNHVQNRIDNMIHYYSHKLVTSIQQSDNPETEIFYVPQTFGIVLLPGSYPWSYQMPPRSMVKVLKYLPLCYAADGIVDFCVASNPNDVVEEGNWVTPLKHARNGGDHYNNLMVTEHVSAYNMITDANRKIAVYGPIIKGLNWLNANKVMDTGISLYPGLGGEDGINLSNVLLNDLHIESEVDGTGYTGQVQCGYYNDNLEIPYFMLVNRRAVYEVAAPAGTPLNDVDLFFQDADPQLICFEPDVESHTIFGTHIAMYDPYDDTVYHPEGTSIEVPIGPGDGKLLQMCATLPETVDTATLLRKAAYIEGEINVLPGGSVTIEPLTDTVFSSDTVVTLAPGTVFTVQGTATFKDNVTFNIPIGASLNIENANCTWEGDFYVTGGGTFTVSDSMLVTIKAHSFFSLTDGIVVNISNNIVTENDVIISVTGGATLNMSNMSCNMGSSSRITASSSTVNIYNCNFDKTNESTNWIGIQTMSSSINMLASEVKNALLCRLLNTNISITNSSFYVPLNGTGLLIEHYNSGFLTSIVNRVANKGFFGVSQESSIGIEYRNANAPILIENVVFNNLKQGIDLTSAGYYGNITNCSFANNNTAIKLTGAIPTITSCCFDSCYTAIVFDFSAYSPRESGVYSSTFSNCNIAIESRASNPRVQGCTFNLNGTGLLCHSDSNMNLSSNAFNTLKSKKSNIMFYDDYVYGSTIQLFSGHNDFYHYIDPQSQDRAVDFSFDRNYTSSTFRRIDASKNWFKDNTVLFDPPESRDNVVVNAFDISPNNGTATPAGGSRYAQALEAECNLQFEPAIAIYKQILDEQLESESIYTAGCLDGIYRITLSEQSSLTDMSDYIESKISQYAVVDSAFTRVLSDYQIKTNVVCEDFQSAIDIIENRLNNPINEVDSLRSVLDLEIVLQLAEMSENKRPATTLFSQYKYPSFQSFSVKHEEHWTKLRELLEHKTPEIEVPIPSVPIISSSYPNPFNPSTTIAFSIPQTGNVKLCVYNIKGQKVKEVLNTGMEKGFHKIVWDGRDRNNRSVSSGIYFFRLESGGQSSVRKAMLMK